MSSAETHGVEFTRGHFLVAWEPPLSFRSSRCGLISFGRGLEELPPGRAWGERIQVTSGAGCGGASDSGNPHTKSRGSRGSHRTLLIGKERVYVSGQKGQLRSSRSGIATWSALRDSSPMLGEQGATSPGLGASGSLHPETCYSPSPESAALLPCNIQKHGTTRETEPLGDTQTTGSFDRKVRSRAARPWLLQLCSLVAGLLLSGAQCGSSGTGQSGRSLVL